MSDFLLELSPQARKLIKTLGLPVPMPQRLRRADGPWREQPLRDEKIAVGLGPRAGLADPLAQTLAAAGAEALLVGRMAHNAFDEAGEAFGRPPSAIGPDFDEPLNALVFDASGIERPEELRPLYDFFHPLLPRLVACGRAVVLGRPSGESANFTAAAARRALDGFVRSLAKESGRRGSTAQLVTVAEGAEERLEGPLRWILSARSAFVSGQPVAIDAVARLPAVPRLWTRPLEGKRALVTGAARGIGKETARRLAEEGAHVVCLDRPADDGPLSQVAREVNGSVLLADVSDAAAPGHIAEQLGAAGGVDVVVHNAGVTRDKTLQRMKPALWDEALDINLAAVARITDALLDGALHDEGRIVCLSSVAGLAGNMGQTNYAASKAGIVGLVEALAPRLAARGITVNAVAPGFIETRLTAAIPVMIREVGRRMSNLGQGGLPQDVAELITFLASPDAAGITGRVIRVCGGALIGA